MRTREFETRHCTVSWIFAVCLCSMVFMPVFSYNASACEPDCGPCMHWDAGAGENGQCKLNTGSNCGDVVIIGGEEQCSLLGTCQTCDTSICDCFNDDTRCNGCQECADDFEGNGICMSICTTCEQICILGGPSADWFCSEPCNGDCETCSSATNTCVGDDNLCDEDKCQECKPTGNCGSFCTEGECCDGSGNCETPDDNWSGGALKAKQISAPDALVNAIEAAIQNIPGCGSADVGIAASTATGSDYKDCCDATGMLYEDGVVKVYANLTGSASVEGIKIWPSTPDIEISKTNPVTGTVYVFTLAGGVYLGGDITIGVEGGERADECIPETCIYGGFEGSVTVSLTVGCSASVCTFTPVGEPTGNCLGVSFGGTISTGIGGEYSYDECLGSSGGIDWSGIDGELSIEVDAPGGYTFSWSMELF